MASGLFNLKQQLQGLIQGAWSGTSSSNAPKYLEYLVVAGGGGGGESNGGGGGAGGLLQGLLPINLATSYTATIGSGGAGGINSSGSAGQNSVFGSITAIGGGGGGSENASRLPTSGGSGGGACYINSPANPGQGVFGQGNAGGYTYTNNSTIYNGGGGGGAGTAGLNGTSVGTGGNGGAGIASAISGTLTTYAGGGGGGAYSGSGGTGGIGGGGNGASPTGQGFPGGTNTGGGGGGSANSYSNNTNGSGGSGIVIVRYAGNTQYFSGGTVTLASGFVIHTFTASGTLAPLSSPVVNGPTNFLSRSLRFRSSNSAYLSRTFGTPTSTTILTFSFWIKRGTVGTQNITFNGGDTVGNNTFYLQFNANNQIDYDQAIGSGTTSIKLISTAVYTDTSAWYHIVAAVDTTQAVASNRVKLYVNGNQITSFATATYPAQNTANQFNVNGRVSNIGKLDYAALYLDAYMADAYFIDGQALTPSSFGYLNYYTNVWTPLAYTGTYGNNGFHLTFTDNTALTTSSNVGLGADTSGNGNYWATSGISITSGNTYDSMVDVPTLSGSASNYATWNPNYNPQTAVITDGNLTLSTAGSTARYGTYTTIGVTSGKFYWEITAGPLATDGYEIGIANSNKSATAALGADTNSYIYLVSGSTRTNNTTVAYGAAYTAGDIIGVALDLNAGTLIFYKNGTSQGTAFTSIPSATWFPSVADDNTGSTTGSSFYANFGQRPFAYTPPAGYVPINTYNLPVTTILQGNLYMDATTYTGTGATASITNAAAFKPDLVWIKSRSAATDHKLTDSVRGVTKAIISDTTGIETTDSQGLTAFNSNGFTIGTDTNYNNSGATYVAWQWQAGAGTSGSNTNGAITSTVSVNTTAGFSVVTYTGTGPGNFTVGHGLGVAPSLIIMKNRDRAVYWIVYTATTGINNFLRLNTTDISTAGTGIWGTSAPTSTVFGGAGTDSSNGYIAGDKIVAYCFAPIAGFSAFGYYTGNGSTTGPFVYLGFQPKYLLIKRTDSTSDWYIWDSVRNTFNTVTNTLLADTAGAETSASSINILSNGFQCVSATVVNVSTGTYIYAAFASNPFKYSNAF